VFCSVSFCKIWTCLKYTVLSVLQSFESKISYLCDWCRTNGTYLNHEQNVFLLLLLLLCKFIPCSATILTFQIHGNICIVKRLFGTLKLFFWRHWILIILFVTTQLVNQSWSHFWKALFTHCIVCVWVCVCVCVSVKKQRSLRKLILHCYSF